MPTEIATFASGCFWGVQHIFLKHYPEGKGIINTTVGYTGGKADATSPDYKTVCTGSTDHAEAVKIEFDPAVVGYDELVEFFYRTHDPTTLNSQGKGHRYTISFRHLYTFSRPSGCCQTCDGRGAGAETLYTVRKEDRHRESSRPDLGGNAEEYHQLYLFKNPDGYQCPNHRLHW
ncbi:peptide methionine sulfoxide reductase [Desarmillaria tabescens]|uniref:peptide-methionine (S)-S-oxide reductase n=1 Tax=Armillaria tabescens TaxID=1929756 RepID=A0AA39MQQ1_ARMTA|nr:peptide methionine sulfoxide reductase [Desarmillaria tabescens]KAK0442310.1 peptide methionine sulfoxide reductase [Desarmillaria tabescens]